MTKRKTKEQCDELFKLLCEQENTPKEDIEILANLLIRVGARHFDDLPHLDNHSRNALFEFVTEHRNRYGETLANALVFQGMIMLNWLDK